ncbi:MAG: hypothetical protein LBJ10_01040 [Clostridiales bacterium]|jgi:hypothetical protein|nr:hypothetical protein [Clostridiales bacterium]
MKNWVREKLKIIGELYPGERIAASKRRIAGMWAGRAPADRYPYTFDTLGFNYYNEVFSKEDGLRAYLDEFIARGAVGDDFIPAFFPGCRQGTIPGMFGAKEIVVGRDHTNERILSRPEDIDSLPYPSIAAGASASGYLEMERYYLEECEGALPVHVCDMQGPMDAAAQLWGYDNLFLCAYDDEKRFHRLLGLCTEAYCILWEAQRDLLGGNFVCTHLFGSSWAPLGNGATLSADSMAMVSEDFFAEYFQPHLEAAASRLGMLSVHSCGDFGAVAGALGRLGCVHAVNASQMTAGELLGAGWDRGKMIIQMEHIDNAAGVFALARENGLRMDATFVGLWPAAPGGGNAPAQSWTPAQAELVAKRALEVGRAAVARM